MIDLDLMNNVKLLQPCPNNELSQPFPRWQSVRFIADHERQHTIEEWIHANGGPSTKPRKRGRKWKKGFSR